MDPHLIWPWVQWTHCIVLCPVGGVLMLWWSVHMFPPKWVHFSSTVIHSNGLSEPLLSFIREAPLINRLSGGIQMGHDFDSISKKVAFCIGTMMWRQAFKELRGAPLYKDIWYLYGLYVNMFWSLVSQWSCLLHNFLVSVWVQMFGLVGTPQNSGWEVGAGFSLMQ